MNRLDEKENVHLRDEIRGHLTRDGFDKEDLFCFSKILSGALRHGKADHFHDSRREAGKLDEYEHLHKTMIKRTDHLWSAIKHYGWWSPSGDGRLFLAREFLPRAESARFPRGLSIGLRGPVSAE